MVALLEVGDHPVYQPAPLPLFLMTGARPPHRGGRGMAMPSMQELIAIKERVEGEFLDRPGVTGVDVGY
jgi:hypothetical protein